METKSCFKCGETLPLDEFYKHPQMADGRLGKCKKCTRADVKANIDKKKNSQAWLEKERARGREKAKRLCLRNNRSACAAHRSHYRRYPEKCVARNLSQHIDTPEGYHKHHWSYRTEHAKDVIFLTVADHAKIHRYLEYDQERMMYRKPGGVLLDSRVVSECFYKEAVEMANASDAMYTPPDKTKTQYYGKVRHALLPF